MFTLPEGERSLLTWLLRKQDGATLAEVAEFARVDDAGARILLDTLAEKGYLAAAEGESPPRFRARVPPRRASELRGNIWQAFDRGRQPPGPQ
jgi:hypothetical protein